MKKRILKQINSPNDLKKLKLESLTQLCEEIRQDIIEVVSRNGGHLASNLGVVELTVAMHRVFNSPEDRIILDVGHQCYAHKMLTGRREAIHTIRKSGGISGFPKCEESVHDAFGTGHSSTSISAALGMLEAKRLLKKHSHVVALIGDGALSGGLSYEALNNAGQTAKNIIIILNDNKMSISESVGSMAYYLSKIRIKSSYIKTKNTVKRVLSKIPFIGEITKKFLLNIKTSIRRFIYHRTFFEDMGFAYYGPVDGHDLSSLIQVLEASKQISGPVLIHVNTQKGRGYSFAEDSPDAFHVISKFDRKTGQTEPNASPKLTFSSVFGDKILNLSEKNNKICAITAAMKDGTGLTDFSCKFPERFFDVGIAEAHAVTFACGLAREGIIPVFAAYSSFLQRSYDQIIHDAAIQNLRIILAVDRAGIIGEDGKTHQGVFDTSFLNAIPNVTIFAPSFFEELKNMIEKSVCKSSGVVVIRYPKGAEWYRPCDFVDSGGNLPFDIYGDINCKIVIVVYGRLFSLACLAKEKLEKRGIKIFIIKLNRIKPISDSLFKIFQNGHFVFFFEEGMVCGGVGEHLGFLLSQKKRGVNFYLKGICDYFVEQSTVSESLKALDLDENGMVETILEQLELISDEKNKANL
ncbi:MAG: 1-deoxy-D-xylulose-5-phosphate synthase [Oscillospiraceae bacterium]|nr:1-deoxy-D-xylulose-5-phosphate synthase [Oscillospiraceae bacterium]